MWESFSNGKDANGDNLVGGGDPAFNQRVLMFLRGQAVSNPAPNGYPKPYVAPSGPGIDASLFGLQRTDQSQVFVFTPVRYGVGPSSMSDLRNLKYAERYGMGADGRSSSEVRDTILDIFAGGRPRYNVIPYIPLDTSVPAESVQLGTDSRGVVLFQYDPNHDGSGTKAWRLFIEGRIIYQLV